MKTRRSFLKILSALPFVGRLVDRSEPTYIEGVGTWNRALTLEERLTLENDKGITYDEISRLYNKGKGLPYKDNH